MELSTICSFPKTKARLDNNWADQNGIDIDTSTNYVEARDFSIEFLLVADNLDSYEVQRELLKEALLASGARTIIVPELNYQFECVYIDCSQFKRMTRSKRPPIVDRFSLKFKLIDGSAASSETIIRITEDGDYRLLENEEIRIL